MVKTITMRLNDEVFEKINKNKTKMGIKKGTSFSWEEYFMTISKLFK